MFDKMVNMARTPMEMEENAAPASLRENIYPYNLCISLTQEELDKLGLNCDDAACEVGNYVHLHALAEVVSKSKNDTGEGPRHSLNLQITHLEIEDEGAENSAADEDMAGAA